MPYNPSSQQVFQVLTKECSNGRYRAAVIEVSMVSYLTDFRLSWYSSEQSKIRCRSIKT